MSGSNDVQLPFSQMSLSANGQTPEDWDRSMRESTPNSIAFPGDGAENGHATPTTSGGKSKRTLSELLRLHAQEGTDPKFTAEEANMVAEVLGQWINAECSPYEGEDTFFSRNQSQDDSALPSSKRASPGFDLSGRPRGQSESVTRG